MRRVLGLEHPARFLLGDILDLGVEQHRRALSSTPMTLPARRLAGILLACVHVGAGRIVAVRVPWERAGEQDLVRRGAVPLGDLHGVQEVLDIDVAQPLAIVLLTLCGFADTSEAHELFNRIRIRRLRARLHPRLDHQAVPAHAILERGVVEVVLLGRTLVFLTAVSTLYILPTAINSCHHVPF